MIEYWATVWRRQWFRVLLVAWIVAALAMGDYFVALALVAGGALLRSEVKQP